MTSIAPPDFTLEIIKDQKRLTQLGETLYRVSAFAVDIETSEWWNRRRERIALLQIAFRGSSVKAKIAVADTLAALDLEVLRVPLEDPKILKIMHNASFDAVRLASHYRFSAAPVHDTMIAARRAGERKYSLKAQAETHLRIRLDKQVQNTEWSRPLDHRRLSYAALDAFATLLLWEKQMTRGLTGEYRLNPLHAPSPQNNLPLDESADRQILEALPSAPQIESFENDQPDEKTAQESEVTAIVAALLGIVTRLPDRYSPAQFSVSLGSENRIGLAGWIIDTRLGRDSELDEETVKMMIADLCERQLLYVTDFGKLRAAEPGVIIGEKM